MERNMSKVTREREEKSERGRERDVALWEAGSNS